MKCSAAVHAQFLMHTWSCACRPGHTEDQLHAQRQHSLPETSPGKSPAGSAAFSPFRGLGTLRARLGSPLGSPRSSLLRHASPYQAASPASLSHRATPDNLSSDHIHQSMHPSPLGAAEYSPDDSEQAIYEHGISRGADDTRWASSTQICLWQTRAQQQSFCLPEAVCAPPPALWRHPSAGLSCYQMELHGRVVNAVVLTSGHREARHDKSADVHA